MIFNKQYLITLTFITFSVLVSANEPDLVKTNVSAPEPDLVKTNVIVTEEKLLQLKWICQELLKTCVEFFGFLQTNNSVWHMAYALYVSNGESVLTKHGDLKMGEYLTTIKAEINTIKDAVFTVNGQWMTDLANKIEINEHILFAAEMVFTHLQDFIEGNYKDEPLITEGVEQIDAEKIDAEKIDAEMIDVEKNDEEEYVSLLKKTSMRVWHVLQSVKRYFVGITQSEMINNIKPFCDEHITREKYKATLITIINIDSYLFTKITKVEEK